MTIDVYAVAWNERVMLPYFLRHYEQFARRIIVWDDDSTDGTRELLAVHPNVELLEMRKHGVDDLYWVRELYPQARWRSADATWTMLVDVDEFVYHPHLMAMLEAAAAAGAPYIECSGYAMVSDREPTTDGQIYDELRVGFPDVMETKWAVVSPTVRVLFRPGRHWMPQFVNGHRCSVTPPPEPYRCGMQLLHYRQLGAQYAAARSANNLARLSDTNVRHKWSRQYRPNWRGWHGAQWYAERMPDARDVVGETCLASA